MFGCKSIFVFHFRKQNWIWNYHIEIITLYSSGSQPFLARGTLIWETNFGGTTKCWKKTKILLFLYTFNDNLSFGGTLVKFPLRTYHASVHTRWETLFYRVCHRSRLTRWLFLSYFWTFELSAILRGSWGIS
jgi:hypothetical protein